MKKLKYCLDGSIRYDLNVSRSEMIEVTVLDTFDNEIGHSGQILLQTEQTLLLINLLSGKVVEQEKGQFSSFHRELGRGPVAAALKEVSKLRAILTVSKVKIRRDRRLILDDEGKTRARLHIISFFCKKKAVQLGMTEFLRGYERAHTDLKDCLLGMGAVPCGEVSDLFQLLGVKRRDYAAKPEIKVASEDPIKESATAIIRAYIDVARRNEKGVLADYDTEFLHDFRVSFRKVRSVLSLFKGVYSADQTRQLKEEFADLMKQTNMLRDLDVYLLDREDYFRMVPENSHDGLSILFDLISRKRGNEHKKVSRIIKSKFYRRQVTGWQKLFSSSVNLSSGSNAEKRSDRYVGVLILNRYRKVCKIARRIDDKTEDKVVHELRIHCKKLRYLMEFSLPFFARKKVKKLLKALKVLQENLGRFNDYSVQQVALAQFISGQNLSAKKSLKVAESIGALSAMLYQLQSRERNLVMENFALFDSEEVHTSFTGLFGFE